MDLLTAVLAIPFSAGTPLHNTRTRPAVEECPAIRTHDRAHRVFVSSSPQELAPERAAARQAIEDLHLTAVMLETGPGAVSPRPGSRTKLRQSDVFVGLYWQRYGRVDPDEDVSGLENEYRQSAGMPRLVYVKEPAFRREPRLAGLLRRIQADGTASYKSFSDPTELGRMLTDDLALLVG